MIDPIKNHENQWKVWTLLQVRFVPLFCDEKGSTENRFARKRIIGTI